MSQNEKPTQVAPQTVQHPAPHTAGTPVGAAATQTSTQTSSAAMQPHPNSMQTAPLQAQPSATPTPQGAAPAQPSLTNKLMNLAKHGNVHGAPAQAPNQQMAYTQAIPTQMPQQYASNQQGNTGTAPAYIPAQQGAMPQSAAPHAPMQQHIQQPQMGIPANVGAYAQLQGYPTGQPTQAGQWNTNQQYEGPRRSGVPFYIVALLQLIPVIIRGTFAGVFMPVFLAVVFTLATPLKYWWIALFLGLLFSSKSVGRAMWNLRKNTSIKPQISVISLLVGGAILGTAIYMVWQQYLFPKPEMSYVLTYEMINELGLFLGQLLEGAQSTKPLFSVPTSIANSELQIGQFCVNKKLALLFPYVGIVWGFFDSWSSPAPTAHS